MYQYILIQLDTVQLSLLGLLMYTIQYTDNIYNDIMQCITKVCHQDQYTLMKIFGCIVYDA